MLASLRTRSRSGRRSSCHWAGFTGRPLRRGVAWSAPGPMQHPRRQYSSGKADGEAVKAVKASLRARVAQEQEQEQEQRVNEKPKVGGGEAGGGRWDVRRALARSRQAQRARTGAPGWPNTLAPLLGDAQLRAPTCRRSAQHAAGARRGCWISVQWCSAAAAAAWRVLVRVCTRRESTRGRAPHARTHAYPAPTQRELASGSQWR